METWEAGPRPEFIYSDNHLLAADKPSGLPSQPDASGDPSLDELAKDYLRRTCHKPGAVYLGLLHRLDRPTSGVVVMARTSKAASRMAAAFRDRQVEKRYLALVACRAAPDPTGRLEDHLAPIASGGMRVAAAGDPGARPARLAYQTLAVREDGRQALLAVDLETGVKHQIRCQLAWAGLPVVGDFRYGPNGRPARPTAVAGGRAILLHARRVAFTHPVRREPVVIEAPLPSHWQPFLAALPPVEPWP
ncbi:MAG: RluA family pseudouridine synthase [Planctomycetes bacterium]|nr:RluA family pseudouridine synthase [Planctomycetota bacterium]